MSALEAERARREKTNKAEVSRQKEPRASTTDAEARAMKLADGGFRPAYASIGTLPHRYRSWARARGDAWRIKFVLANI
jgi:hypothetical protein